MNTTPIGKILVVDDEIDLRNILVESLTSQGYETSGLTSSDQALAALRAEPFDVLLTDLMMPGIDGITLVHEGLEIDPHLVCIVMTDQGTLQTAVDAMKVGAFDYVLKPFGLQTLLHLITRAMNARHMRLENLQLRETLAIYESQKMEAIAQLARGVAHDFNNLLTAINGYSSLALQRVDPDTRIKGYLEEIRKAGDRAGNLTRQLLAFGRKQMLNPVAMSLNDVISDTNKMIRGLIGEDIRLIANLDPELRKIKADAGQVEQVLVNLVVNSRDAMPQGGVLTIETTNFDVDQEYTSKHLGVPPGGYVMLAVSDTGCGMNMETRARIFEPFFTTKDKGKGTGLGLSTVYGIVKQSGGAIWVYSEPRRGTTLKVYLPQFEGDEEPARRASLEIAAPRGWETILLVEDEDIVRRLARQILQQAGYHVLVASCGEEAMRLCRERSEPIHLLLTDVVMPETSGKEIARCLTSLRPATRVLFMSGYTGQAIVHHGVLDANVEFIQKPFMPVALARKVREVLDLNCGDRCER